LVNNTLFDNASGGIVLGTDDNFTVDHITVSSNVVVSFAISGPFRFGGLGTCGMTVAAQSTCTISVVLSPTSVGQATGAVKLTDNAGSDSQTITLSGYGN